MPRLQPKLIARKCERCKHRWLSRVEEPVVCPRCKSYRWMEKKK